MSLKNLYHKKYVLTFTEHVKEMKRLANQLIPFSFPIKTPKEDDEISCLKQRELVVDGYELVLYSNKCRYDKIELETLQIYGKYFTYLPFNLTTKIAKTFLGTKNLCFYDSYRGEKESTRKVYVWAVYYQDKQPIRNSFINGVDKTFEDLDYYHMNGLLS